MNEEKTVELLEAAYNAIKTNNSSYSTYAIKNLDIKNKALDRDRNWLIETLTNMKEKDGN